MITKIEARNYRCLKRVSQELKPFQVLVGPNGSGKSTLLDVPLFIGSMMREGLNRAISERSVNGKDLVFGGKGESFELAIEVEIPHEVRSKLPFQQYERIRYAVAVEIEGIDGKPAIKSEIVSLQSTRSVDRASEWDRIDKSRESTLLGKLELQQTRVGTRYERPPLVLNLAVRGGVRTRLVVTSEIASDRGLVYLDPTVFMEGSILSFAASRFPVPNIEGTKVAKAKPQDDPTNDIMYSMSEPERDRPASLFLMRFLATQVYSMDLHPRVMKHRQQRTLGSQLLPDGSNLGLAVERFKNSNPDRYRHWIDHVRTAVPDIADVHCHHREDEGTSYLEVKYDSCLTAPAWIVSDGTLRLLGLTFLSYAAEHGAAYLIEEPENGVHPQGIETIYQSLSSVYDSQVLLSTHSPMIVGLIERDELDKVLCFSRTAEEGVRIVRGDKHPWLVDWKGSPNLSVYFASGVLS